MRGDVPTTGKPDETLAGLMATGRYDTDKEPHYLRTYEELFRPLRDRPVRLLELGIHRGGSLRLWRDYFPLGLIVGLDAEPPPPLQDGHRIRCYRGLQQDTAVLDRLAQEQAPEGFDIIIDDASHVADLTRTSFWHLFEHHLRPGGIYAIEDWGTGYWNSWSDGRRYEPGHRHGMVGFVKELVDECGMPDITHPGLGVPPPRNSRFERMYVMPGLAVVVKRPLLRRRQATSESAGGAHDTDNRPPSRSLFAKERASPGVPKRVRSRHVHPGCRGRPCDRSGEGQAPGRGGSRGCEGQRRGHVRPSCRGGHPEAAPTESDARSCIRPTWGWYGPCSSRRSWTGGIR